MGLVTDPPIADLLRGVLDREPIGVAVFAPAGDDFVHVYVNAAREALKPDAPMKGRTYGEVWPELADLALPRMREVSRSGAPWVERDIALQVETGGGARETRHFSLEISRLELAGAPFLVDLSIDTTSQVEARAELDHELAGTRALLRAADAIARWTDLHDVAQGLAEILLELTSHKRSIVDTYDEDTREIVVVGSAGEQPFPIGSRWPLDEVASPSRDAIRQRRTAVYDFEKLPVEERGIAADPYRLHQLLYVPLVQREKVVGLIVLDDPGERRDFTAREISLVEGIAAEAAVTIENARLFGSLTGELARSNVLRDVSAAASSGLEPQDVAASLLRAVERHLGLQAGDVRLLSEDRRRIRLLADVGWPESTRSALRDVAVADSGWIASRVVTDGRALTQDDEGEIPPKRRRFLEDAGLLDSRYVALPLRYAGDILGVLSLTFAGRRQFTREETDLFESIAGTVSQAMANARLFASARRELARTTVLKEAATASQTLDPVEVAERVLSSLKRSLGLSSAAVYSLDEETGALRNLALHGYPPEAAPLFAEVPVDDASITGQAVGHDELRVYRYEDLPSATRARANAVGETASTWAAVPIHARGRVIGNLTLVFEAAHAFGEDELDLFRSIADQLGVAMENARLYEAERDSSRLTSILAEVSSVLTATLDLSEGMPEALRLAADGLGAYGATVASREEGGWLMRYAYGVELERMGTFHSDEESPVRMEVLRTRQPQLVADIEKDARADIGRARRAGFRAFLSVPLLFRDNVIGALSFLFAEPRAHLSELQRNYVRRLVFVIASAQENVRLYEREREAARLGGVLAEIDAGVHSSLRVAEAVKSALALGAEAIGAESAAIDGIEGDRWVAWYDHGFQPSIVGDTYTDEQNPHGAEAVRTGRAVAIEDAFTDPRTNSETMKAYGLRSVIVAPLIVRGTGIAAVYYNYHAATHRFPSAEIDFVTKIASSVSLAIENARLFEAQERVADTLQEALLTLPDSVGGLDFAHTYHSATEAARVGGDFYDIFELEHGLVGITVGDIAGKGLDAAVLTSLVKNAIRAEATESGRTPGEVLRLANTVLFRASPEESFATVFFAVLDREDGTLRYANGGHTTGAIVSAAGDPRVRELRATGTLVGAFPEAVHDEARERLAPGEVLFLYTDGLTEARRDADFFGEDRLFALLADLAGREPEVMLSAVLDEVVAFAGGSLSDDLAILALRRTSRERE